MRLSLLTITQYEFTLVAFRQKLDKGGGRRRGGGGRRGKESSFPSPLSPYPPPTFVGTPARRNSRKAEISFTGVTFPISSKSEFLPYRRVDGTAQRDERIHSYFCCHGYVGVRVDIRGTGDSEGFYYDEYTKQEQDDCCDIISWISEQSWCSGAVGELGTWTLVTGIAPVWSCRNVTIVRAKPDT